MENLGSKAYNYLTSIFSYMRKLIVIFLLAFFWAEIFFPRVIYAQRKVLTPTPTLEATTESNSATAESDSATASATIIERTEPTEVPRPDLTEKSKETVEPLKKLLEEQKLGSVFINPVKYAIRAAVTAGVPPNTIVLLLLLPGVATLIAGTRHLVGLRGFGIFLPAALAVTFVATGPIVGIGLFLLIVAVSTASRIFLRRTKIKLQYLPRMAIILLFVVLGILALLFSTPIINSRALVNVSIFPVLVLVLLAEDFSKVQLGKSAKVAINLTTETLILALISYVLLTLKSVQELALLKPELWITSILVIDIILGKYAGLRLMEYFRFRKLITK